MNNKGSDKNVANIEDIKVIQHIISFYKDLDVIHSNDKCKEIVALENVLAEREQKDKRIKELEEENTLQRRQLNSAFDNGYIHTDKIRKLIANETINISGFECIAVEDLQELLEGEIHENRT